MFPDQCTSVDVPVPRQRVEMLDGDDKRTSHTSQHWPNLILADGENRMPHSLPS